MHLTYRTASTNEFETLKQLGLKAFSQFESVLTPTNWKTLYDGLNDDSRLTQLISKSIVFVCMMDQKLVGVAYFVPSGNPEGIFQQDWSCIRRVGVDPDYRGQGIARKLTQLCIDQARATNESVIALHTSEFMDDARHIYESLGFKRIKEIDPIFGKRYWLYMLELS